MEIPVLLHMLHFWKVNNSVLFIINQFYSENRFFYRSLEEISYPKAISAIPAHNILQEETELPQETLYNTILGDCILYIFKTL